jgi:hypothetical protein
MKNIKVYVSPACGSFNAAIDRLQYLITYSEDRSLCIRGLDLATFNPHKEK